MNRNQKIALGCGGAGCLGLILLAVIGIFGYMTYTKSSMYTNRNRNTNFNTNRDSNANSPSDDAITNNENDNSSTSSVSEDGKHKLFQAAGITKDSELILKVLKKIGYPTGTGAGYQTFVKEHFAWAMKNVAFMQTVNTPEKGRAYVEAHLDD